MKIKQTDMFYAGEDYDSNRVVFRQGKQYKVETIISEDGMEMSWRIHSETGTYMFDDFDYMLKMLSYWRIRKPFMWVEANRPQVNQSSLEYAASIIAKFKDESVKGVKRVTIKETKEEVTIIVSKK